MCTGHITNWIRKGNLSLPKIALGQSTHQRISGKQENFGTILGNRRRQLLKMKAYSLTTASWLTAVSAHVVSFVERTGKKALFTSNTDTVKANHIKILLLIDFLSKHQHKR